MGNGTKSLMLVMFGKLLVPGWMKSLQGAILGSVDVSLVEFEKVDYFAWGIQNSMRVR